MSARTILQNIWARLKGHKYKSLLVLASLLIITTVAAQQNNAPEAAAVKAKRVEVIRIADAVSDGGVVPVVGQLKANQQLDLRPQMPGPVSAVWVKLGQYVRPGQVLVEVAHRDLDASVAQASANLQSAAVQLEKTKNGLRPEDILIAEENVIAAQKTLQDMKNGGRPEQVAQAQNNVVAAETALDEANTNYVRTEQQNAQSLASAFENAVLAIDSAQVAVDKVLHEDLDNLFNANDGDNLIPVITDVVLEAQTNESRDASGARLNSWRFSTSSLVSTNHEAVFAALNTAATELSAQVAFLELTNKTMLDALATPSYPQTSVDAAKAAVNAARATVKTHLSAVTTSRQGIESLEITNQRNLETARGRIDSAAAQLKNAQEQLAIVKQGATADAIAAQESRVRQAEQQLAIARNGARPEDIRLQEAMVAQARASLSLAAANRDKAIIRAPIGGTVTYLPSKIGDLLSSSSIAISIANASVLEVETYVSESERRFIELGAQAIVNDEIKAQVREISPALDPVNNKIKVVVTLTDAASNLTLGETVRVGINKVAPEQSILRLPLTAVKLSSSKAEVFTVDGEVLNSLTVETGSVLANTIDIMTPLAADLLIVKDARGLKAGQIVEIRE